MIKQIVIAGIAASALATATASAAIIDVTSVNGSWTATNPAGVTTSSANGGTNNRISWGDPATGSWWNPGPQSGYQFDSLAPILNIAEETAFDLGTFTHFNFPIYDDGTVLNSATLEIQTQLEIDSVSHSLTSFFNFTHNETPNSSNPCADGGANGSGVNINGCADEVSFNLNAGATDSVSINGTEYFIDLLGFFTNGSLTDTFWTQEDLENTATLRGVITSVTSEVPEPSTFALLGLGLIGLGLRNRKRKQS
ncbi:PEP-CTERM sorting domain-containing protein [Marinobacter adhaerens]|uniref:PEP-CTERM sorting domain-containing protein n=1 Tax=Marinobacter adhaerens TaxID=1033846 RepID=A0A851HWP3_9GAMM|nr:THxN family PEP-CTERM protein [Marinobacter adhaerens]NWN91395.1 PEP-CTERM sorting domain-containing protein [Marinobacter adhaerens]